MNRPLLKFPESERDELFLDIVESLKVLPEVLRKVYIRSHYENKTIAEIAEELEIPPQSVSDLLANANEIFYRNLHRFHPRR